MIEKYERARPQVSLRRFRIGGKPGLAFFSGQPCAILIPDVFPEKD
jgi:hypothetical protein